MLHGLKNWKNFLSKYSNKIIFRKNDITTNKQTNKFNSNKKKKVYIFMISVQNIGPLFLRINFFWYHVLYPGTAE